MLNVYVSLCLLHSGSNPFVVFISKETQILPMQGCVEEQDHGDLFSHYEIPERLFDGHVGSSAPQHAQHAHGPDHGQRPETDEGTSAAGTDL